MTVLVTKKLDSGNGMLVSSHLHLAGIIVYVSSGQTHIANNVALAWHHTVPTMLLWHGTIQCQQSWCCVASRPYHTAQNYINLPWRVYAPSEVNDGVTREYTDDRPKRKMRLLQNSLISTNRQTQGQTGSSLISWLLNYNGHVIGIPRENAQKLYAKQNKHICYQDNINNSYYKNIITNHNFIVNVIHEHSQHWSTLGFCLLAICKYSTWLLLMIMGSP